MDAEAYLSEVANIFSGAIIRVLAGLPPQTAAVVLGGRSINAMLRRQFQIASVDWDLNVWDRGAAGNERSLRHENARDVVGLAIAAAINAQLRAQPLRLEPLGRHFDTQLRGAVYVVNPRVFVGFDGFRYRVGHVDFETTRFGLLGFVDLVARPHSGDYVAFDGVRFLLPRANIQILRHLISLPGNPKRDRHQRRLRALQAAMRGGGLSCNYYRAVRDLARLRSCAQTTALGPIDPLFPAAIRPLPRFRASARDRTAHARYIQTLPPEVRTAIRDYTRGESADWNVLLIHNALFPRRAYALPAGASRLQAAILAAPPLLRDLVVYRVARYMFLSAGSNFELAVGARQRQYVFSSASYDNAFNPTPFIEPFAACCAYEIRVPRGSHVLIVDSASTYPDEREVILPANCEFIIRERRLANITRARRGSIFYDELDLYAADYVDPSGTPEAKQPPALADLTELGLDNTAFWQTMSRRLRRILARLYGLHLEATTPKNTAT